MENKKKTSSTKKTTTTKKSAVKKTVTAKKKTPKKKKRSRGFTLIELLAVIIILGVLMIIAIPSVTTYISNSRKESYIDSAKNIVGSARNFINSGKYEVYDENVTYYIPVKCLPSENGTKTPYGNFTKAYVGVTYTGNGFEYYWISTDSAGQGIKNLYKVDKLTSDLIESNLTDNDINSFVSEVGIGDTEKIRIMDEESCKEWEADLNALKNTDGDGNIISNEPIVIVSYTNIHPDYKLHNNNCGKKQTIGECLGADTIFQYPQSYCNCIKSTNDYYGVTDETIWYEHTGPSGYGNWTWGQKMKTCYENYHNSVITIDKNTKARDVQINACYSTVPASIPRYTCLSIDTEVIVLEEDKNGKKRKVRKKLSELKYTDLVLVWDFDNKEFAWAKPLWIRKEETSKSYYLIKFSDGSELKVIGEHKIFNADKNEFVSLLKAKVGFNTFNSNGELVKVVSRELIEDEIQFTSVITNYHMNLFTNDVLTSISFNNLYKIDNMKFIKDDISNNSNDMYEGVSKKYYDGLRLSEMGLKFSTIDVIETVKGYEETRK